VGRLLLGPVVGSVGGGARRWIALGFFSLAPSELVKVTLLLVLARDFHRSAPPRGYGLRELLYPAVLAAIPAGLILAEPNLGTALVLGLLFLTLVFAAGVRLRSLLLTGLAGGGALPPPCHPPKSH